MKHLAGAGVSASRGAWPIWRSGWVLDYLCGQVAQTNPRSDLCFPCDRCQHLCSLNGACMTLQKLGNTEHRIEIQIGSKDLQLMYMECSCCRLCKQDAMLLCLCML